MIKSTKRAHRSNKKNIFVALMLVAALAITGAFAYLTAQDSAENKFTVGNVDIELTEPNWNASNGENIVPGQVIAKDPTIENTGANDAYIYIGLWMPKLDSVKVDGTIHNDYELFSFDVNEGWEELNDYRLIDTEQAYNYYLYAYNTSIEPGTSKALFNDVTVNNISEGLENILPDYSNIVVQGYAIQSDFYGNEATDAASAWELYVNQNNWKWPNNPAENFASYFSAQRNLLSRAAYDTAAPLTINQTPSATNGTFRGWIADTGVLYQNGDTVDLDELYVTDSNGTVLNQNPKFNELVRYDNPEEGTDQIMLIPREGSTTVIDRGGQSVKDYEDGVSTWFVYGIDDHVRIESPQDPELQLDHFIDVQGNGYYEVVGFKGKGSVGTGTTINVYDKATDELVESLRIIIYGDLDGDGIISVTDYTQCLTEAANFSSWSNKSSSEYDLCRVKAVSFNGDDVFSSLDVAVFGPMIEKYVLGTADIDQTTGTILYAW